MVQASSSRVIHSPIVEVPTVPNPLKKDIHQLSQSDPSLIGGYSLVFDRMCQVELHVVDEAMIEKIGHPVSSAESMNIKILIKGHDESPEIVKVELLSKKDYFFLYEHTCDVFDFQEMKEAQGLLPSFNDYLTMLIKLFNNAISTPDTHKVQIQLNPDNSGDVFFNQVLPFKQLQLLGCHFTQGEDGRVQQHIKYRHQVARLKLQQMEQKLAVVCKNIKEKNPSLIQHICKEVQSMRLDRTLELDVVKSRKAGSKGRRSNGPLSSQSRNSQRSKMSQSRRSLASSMQ